MKKLTMLGALFFAVAIVGAVSAIVPDTEWLINKYIFDPTYTGNSSATYITSTYYCNATICTTAIGGGAGGGGGTTGTAGSMLMQFDNGMMMILMA